MRKTGYLEEIGVFLSILFIKKRGLSHSRESFFSLFSYNHFHIYFVVIDGGGESGKKLYHLVIYSSLLKFFIYLFLFSETFSIKSSNGICDICDICDIRIMELI